MDKLSSMFTGMISTITTSYEFIKRTEIKKYRGGVAFYLYDLNNRLMLVYVHHYSAQRV